LHPDTRSLTTVVPGPHEFADAHVRQLLRVKRRGNAR